VAQAIIGDFQQPNGKGKKAKAAKIISWSIRADVVRNLDRGEAGTEAYASGPLLRMKRSDTRQRENGSLYITPWFDKRIHEP
jgi:hypothetical protein